MDPAGTTTGEEASTLAKPLVMAEAGGLNESPDGHDEQYLALPYYIHPSYARHHFPFFPCYIIRNQQPTLTSKTDGPTC